MDCIKILVECIDTTWLLDCETLLLKRAFEKDEVVIGAIFKGQCFIATNQLGQDYIMSENTVNEEIVEWFYEHFKIVSYLLN